LAAFPENNDELLIAAHRVSAGEKRAWLLPWFLLLLILGTAALEWFYSPVEKGFGNLMFWSRDVRPEAGRGWELNREGAEAMRTLDEFAENTRLRQTAGTSINDWEQIPSLMDSFQVLSISPDRFLRLYEILPPAMQSIVVDPVELLRLRTSGRWQRVFIMNERDQHYIYLVDSYNVVLLQGKLDAYFHDIYSRYKRPVQASLKDLDHFIYTVPIESFFQTLSPNGMINLSANDLQWITSLRGRLVRMGIAREGERDIRELGFETTLDGRPYTYRYWIDSKLGGELEYVLSDITEDSILEEER